MPKEPKDGRSTYRKRARAVLQKLVDQDELEFACVDCGWVPVGELGRDNNLDVNHINKNIEDCDPSNLEYVCRTCHRKKDRATAKGVSSKGDEWGYFEGVL